MKQCTKCKKRKRLSSFSVRKDTPCGVKSRCKECIREYSRKRFKNNREYYRLRSQKRASRLRQLVQEHKNKPCMDCKNAFPYYVMEFDHRPEEEKLFAVSLWMKQNCGVEGILAEIAKCDVVCSNCHRVRTHNRKQNELSATKN